LYITEFEEFYSWLIEQKANGQWLKFSTFLDNRIGIEREMIMTLLGSLSRDDPKSINALIEQKATINVLEEIRDLVHCDVKQLTAMVGVKGTNYE